MSPSACPDREERLEAFLFGELADEDRREMERHLSACTPCRVALDDARAALGALAEIEAPPLPYAAEKRDPWQEFRLHLQGVRGRPPRAPVYRFAAVAALLLVGIGIGRLLAPAGPLAPAPLEEAARIEAEAIDALERAELLADVGMRYLSGVKELLSEATAGVIETASTADVYATRERARALVRDGRLLARSLDPERDRLFLRSIERAEIFLEDLSALEPSQGVRQPHRLQASLSQDLGRLDLEEEVARAYEASGPLGFESGLGRKDF